MMTDVPCLAFLKKSIEWIQSTDYKKALEHSSRRSVLMPKLTFKITKSTLHSVQTEWLFDFKHNIEKLFALNLNFQSLSQAMHVLCIMFSITL